MTDFPNILSAKIVGEEINIFWDEKNLSSDAGQVPVLVLSAAYPPGGAEDTQLQKIMQACTLSADQYYVLPLQNDEQLAWFGLREKLLPKVVLLVGITPATLGISAMFRLNAPNSFDDRIFIPCVSLADMEKYPDQKKELWQQALKPVFVDKQYGNIL